VHPRYWVAQREVDDRLADKDWTRQWLLGFRDICRATDERTVIASIIPRTGVGNKFPLMMPRDCTAVLAAAFVGNLSALCLDFVSRQKLGGTTMNYFYIKQFPVLPPNAFSAQDLRAISSRVVELVYTSADLHAFYADVVEEDPACDPRTGLDRNTPWGWDPQRRAAIRAELDAIYARLYGLSRDELRYILDPADVMGVDYPSETFRVLKSKEIRHLGEYRTQRLVLEAWDRMQAGQLV